MTADDQGHDQDAPSRDAALSSAPALRMRRHRERRRRGLRCLTIELRWAEIESLVRRGLLRPDTRNNSRAIVAALYAFLDRNLVSAL